MAECTFASFQWWGKELCFFVVSHKCTPFIYTIENVLCWNAGILYVHCTVQSSNASLWIIVLHVTMLCTIRYCFEIHQKLTNTLTHYSNETEHRRKISRNKNTFQDLANVLICLRIFKARLRSISDEENIRYFDFG